MSWDQWLKRTATLEAMLGELTEQQWALAAEQSRLTQRQGELADATNKLRPALIAHLRQVPHMQDAPPLARKSA